MSEIRVNNIANEAGTGAPVNLSYGAQVPTGMGITGAGGINITGVITAGVLQEMLLELRQVNWFSKRHSNKCFCTRYSGWWCFNHHR